MQTEPANEIIPVRATSSLKDALDKELNRRRQESPGQRITRADVIRSLLWTALAKRDAA